MAENRNQDAECMLGLAKRHGLSADELIEVRTERASIREYLGGFRRRTAELFAIGDVEQMYNIGLHCPVSRQRWLAGGKRLSKAAP